jgi:hypothetical protein
VLCFLIFIYKYLFFYITVAGDSSIQYEDKVLQFRGARIRSTIIEHLLWHKHMNKADEVVVSSIYD